MSRPARLRLPGLRHAASGALLIATWSDIVINLAIIAIVVITSLPLGRYVWKVFTDQRTWLDTVFEPIERLVLRATGVPIEEQDWRAYVVSLLASNVVMWVVAFAVLTVQARLPLNPDRIGGMDPTLAFNTASSVTTDDAPALAISRRHPE